METAPEHLSPVRAVVARTGVPAHLLRAWERRYGAIEPGRTEGGQRRYSEADVERIRLLRDVVSQGESISAVARLPDADLRRLLESRRDQESASSPAVGTSPGDAESLRRAMRAVEDRDPAALREVLMGASVRLPLLGFLEGVLAPLLRQIGESWSQGTLGVAEEHLASQEIRSLLGELQRSAVPRSDAPVLLVATPSGQTHEFGALFAALVGSQAGWKAIYLGSDLPADEVVRVAAETDARAVALGVLYPRALPGDGEGRGFLEELRSTLRSEAALYIGGHPTMREVAEQVAGVTPLATLAELERRLVASSRSLNGSREKG
jgi:MerR family transcriptional regulator, light-induced transcriptional regulator